MNDLRYTRQLTPLFNTNALEQELGNGANLTLDKGLWKPLETLLPARVPLLIKQYFKDGICEIQTPAYPSKTSLYTYTRFLTKAPELPQEWKRPLLPPLSVFLSRINWCLEKRIPYLWGGNAPNGTLSLYHMYRRQQPRLPLDQTSQNIWKLKGVDCSGLIYWATRGATGRNTSELIREGTRVNIEGLSNEQIVAQLKPGMLIVWTGHVLIVTEEGIVDSTPEKGVSFTPILEKINALTQTRVPLDEWPSNENPIIPSFVVRRLYPEKKITFF